MEKNKNYSLKRVTLIFLQAILLIGVFIYWLYLTFKEIHSKGCFDWMLFSAVGCFLLVSGMSFLVSPWFKYSLQKFERDGTLIATSQEIDNVVETQSNRTGFIVAILTSFAITTQVYRVEPELFLVCFICTLVAGYRLGILLNYISFDGILKKNNLQWNILPDHPDGLGGTSSVGWFYFFSGLITIAPLLWSVCWLLAIPNLFLLCELPFFSYNQWHLTVEITALISFCFIVTNFLIPIFLFHCSMHRKYKKILEDQMPMINKAISELQRELKSSEISDARRVEVNRVFGSVLKQRNDYDNLPVWPIKIWAIAFWFAPWVLTAVARVPFVSRYTSFMKALLLGG